MHKTRLTFIGLFALIAASAGLSLWKNDVSGFSTDVIHYPSTPTLHNIAGEKISTVEVGQQSVIRISVHNNNPTEQPLVLIVEVRNGNGVTEHLAWQSGKIASNSDYTMETSWTPHAYCGGSNEACSNYEIRSFAITSLENPQVLSAVSGIDGITVTGSPPIPPSPGHYDLFFNNQTFQIDYSFSGRQGKITHIQVASETESMTLYLMAPENSRLSIYMPQEFVKYVFPNSIAAGEELIAFVDEVAVDMNQIIDDRTGSLIFEIPVKQESKQIEIVGNALIWSSQHDLN